MKHNYLLPSIQRYGVRPFHEVWLKHSFVHHSILKLNKELNTVLRIPYVHTVPSRWSLPVGVSGARPTTNHINLPPRTLKHAGDWLELVLAYDFIGWRFRRHLKSWTFLNFRSEQRRPSDATEPQCSSAKLDVTPFTVNGKRLRWSTQRNRVDVP